jgi:hypothetical protein
VAFLTLITATLVHVGSTLTIWRIAGIPLFRDSRLGAFEGSGGFGILERLAESSALMAIFAVVYLLLHRKRLRRNVLVHVFLLWFVCAIALSGSKAALLSVGQFVLSILFVYTALRNARGRFWGGRAGKALLVGATLFAVAVLATQNEGDLVSAGLAFAYRVASFGDVYVFAYPNGTIESVQGSNPLVGLFGGFLSTFRLFPQESVYPNIGYQFTGIVFPDLELIVGPNPQHPVFGYHYFGPFAFVFSFALGLFTSRVQARFYNRAHTTFVSGNACVPAVLFARQHQRRLRIFPLEAGEPDHRPGGRCRTGPAHPAARAALAAVLGAAGASGIRASRGLMRASPNRAPPVVAVAVCYHMKPAPFIDRLQALAAGAGRRLQGVVVNNQPEHATPAQSGDLEVVQGTNRHLDFSGYFEGLQHLPAVSQAETGNVLFVNDSLLTAHASTTIFRRVLALDGLLQQLEVPAGAGKLDPYRSICLRNPWSGHGSYLSTFCFLLNGPAQPILRRLATDAEADGVLAEAPLEDPAWGAGLDAVTRSTSGSSRLHPFPVPLAGRRGCRPGADSQEGPLCLFRAPSVRLPRASKARWCRSMPGRDRGPSWRRPRPALGSFER